MQITCLEYENLPCLEDVPTCGDTCDRKLDCGLHRCLHRCHTGDCESVSEVKEIVRMKFSRLI